LYNQIEAILSQYDMEINGVTKGRGSYICNTNQGMKELVPFCGSKEKGIFLKEYLSKLNKKGFVVEQIVQNKNEEVITEDEGTGERFVLKDYVEGKELNTSSREEMKEAVLLLADYHRTSTMLEIEIPDKLKGNEKTVTEGYRRHYRELVKVKNYIRNRKKKNEFEQIYMKYFSQMLSTAEESIICLEKKEGEVGESGICHGEVNQHNIIHANGRWYMIHFENCSYSWRITDLANFLRKMMEKNNWDIELGLELIKSYDSHYELHAEELQKLYGILLFPEKFWKITNHYINSRKTWISERDIDKLKKVIEQENQRINFVQNLFQMNG